MAKIRLSEDKLHRLVKTIKEDTEKRGEYNAAIAWLRKVEGSDRLMKRYEAEYRQVRSLIGQYFYGLDAQKELRAKCDELGII